MSFRDILVHVDDRATSARRCALASAIASKSEARLTGVYLRMPYPSDVFAAERLAYLPRAAAEAADLVVVTDDNPRSEEPAAIRAAVLAGAREAGGAEVVDGGDRRAAIARALRLARPADWVAGLGKGHETGQDVAGVISPFDDVAVIRETWGE